MRNKKMKLFLGIVVLACALVAIFSLFGNLFADVNSIPDGRGSIFGFIFRAEEMGYNEMPLFTTAFAFFVAASVFALLGGILPGKIGGIVLGVTTLLLLTGAIILLNGKGIFLAAGTITGAPAYDVDDLALGVGAILPSVFAILGSVLGLYGAYLGIKA